MSKDRNHSVQTIAATILLSLLSACSAKIHVQKQPEAPSSPDKAVYVFYALPKTVIETKLPVTAQVRSPGKYAKYTATLFPEIEPDDYVKGKEIGLEFGKPEIGTYALPDLTEVYRIKIKKPWAGLFGDRMINLTMSEEGVLNRAEASASNQAVDAVLSIAGLGLGYAPASLFGADKATVDTQSLQLIPKDVQALAREIRDLQAAYRKLIKDPQTCCAEASLKELKAEIARLLTKFVGTKRTIVWNAVFDWDPTEPCGDSQDHVLLEYSKTKGVCNANMGAVIPEGMELPKCNDEGDPVRRVVLRVYQSDGLYKSVEGAYIEPEPDEITGFRYKLPASVPVEVLDIPATKTEVELGRGVASVAQLGYTATLPRSTGSRKTQFVLDLYPSGALKNFQVASEARLKAGDIDSAKESLDSYLERRQAARDAAAPPDELEELEKERRLLEEQIRIRRYNQELETGVPAEPL